MRDRVTIEAMTDLQELVDQQYAAARVPGAVALVQRGDQTEVACAGERTVDGPPMTRNSLFRVASIAKPITAAATMVLVERGVLELDDAVSRWLPELEAPVVLRTPESELDDVVPAERAITVRDLLTLRGGHGYPSDFDSCVPKLLTERLHQGPPRPLEWFRDASFLGSSTTVVDAWMARLAEIPLLHQPGDGWTYNTGYDVLGVLLGRATSSSLGEVLADTVLEPLGMRDTSFWTTDTDRMTSLYQRGDDGFDLIDPPDGQWTSPPPFESGAGGLVSTVDDWCAFGRMLLDGGGDVLSPESVSQMMTSHVEAEPGNHFLDGQGWGFGGGVDVQLKDPWNVIGRYGWVGGTGTAGYVIPSTDTVVVWLAQVEFRGPEDGDAVAAVLTYAAQ
jgi:CubicO group peptidase (beta-lactamase class C family)